MSLKKGGFRQVADGTVVSIQDGKPEATPNILMKPETKDDYGGNSVILQIAPHAFALYLHLHPGSLTVKVGDVVKAGAPLARIGNTGSLVGSPPSFQYCRQPDLIAGRSLPFVFDSFTSAGSVDFDASKADRLVILPDSRQVHSAHPLLVSIQNYPLGDRRSHRKPPVQFQEKLRWP